MKQLLRPPTSRRHYSPPFSKKDSNLLFNAYSSSGNIFSWDASESLSEASEVGFTRWINHVFLQGMAVRELQPVATGPDAGTSARSARFSETIITDAKAAALRLLQSPSFAAPAHRIEREVDARKFRVHPDANLRADKGLQQRVCEIFLAHYSPLWLQICVDVLSAFTAPTTNSVNACEKSLTISGRVQSYLFGAVPPLPKAKLEEEEPSIKGKHPNARKPVGWGRNQHVPVTFNDHYNRQIVKRVLVLIWLLDQSRAKQIVRYSPCLFKLKSMIKSSAEVLLKFANLCLQGEVNLVRALSAIGATVCVSQNALDEFDFTVKNLAVDLRDGLRLVKLADLLLEGKVSTDHSGLNDSGSILSHVGNLMSLVRFPPISRLQKIHNVGIALSAFEAASEGKNLFTAAGKPISERDIVDGHRSKTLSLLWCILLRFQVTALLDLPSLRSEIYRLVRKSDDIALTQAVDAVYNAVGMVETERNQRVLFLWTTAVMQAYNVKVSNLDQSFADGRIFCYLLHFYLPTLLPKGLVRTPTTLTPDLHPDVPAAMRTRNNLYNLRLFHRKIAHLGDVPTLLNVGPGLFVDTAYTCLPSANRSAPIAVTVLSPGIVLATLAYLASRLVRPVADRAQLKRVLRDHAARIIQMAWRAAVQSRQLAAGSVPLKKTPPPLRFSVDVPATRRTSPPGRRSSQMSDSASSPLSPDQAAVKIQAWYRGWLARRALVRQRQDQAAGLIQAAYQSYLRRRKFRSLVFCLLEQNWAAVLLQAIVRGYLARLHYAKERSRRLSAVLTLQKAFRAFLERRRRRHLCRLQSVMLAALAVVKFSRTLLRHRRRVAAATIIQTRFRSVRARKLLIQQAKEAAAATRLQALARGYLARRMFARRRAEMAAERARQTASITIQAHVRSFLVRLRAARQRQISAAIVIQAHFRGYRVRSTYRAYREWNAAIILQAAARGFLARRRVARCLEERRRNTAATLIQARFRGYRARRAFVNYRLWNAAVLLQAYIRGFLERRKYQSWRHAAVLIQSHVRGYLVRRKLAERRAEAHRQQLAAIIIQTAYRKYRVRRIRTAQLEFRAACVIQAYVRGFLARREHLRRREVHRCYVAATLIQARFRGYRARRNFLLYRQMNAAVVIQRWWRQRLVRIREIRREKAAVCIQRSWRAYSLSRWLSRRQRAAVIIQAAWRGWKVRTAASARPLSSVNHVSPSNLIRARRRIAMATKRAQKNPSHRLGPRARIALADLLKYTSVAQILDALNNLDTVTRLSREVCFWLADVNPSDQSSRAPAAAAADSSRLRQPADIILPSHSSVFFPHVLLRLLQSCNRSVANEEIILTSLFCLLNMARHRELAARVQIWWRPPPTPAQAAPRRRSLGDKSQSTADTRPALTSACSLDSTSVSSVSSSWMVLSSSSSIDPTVEYRHPGREQPHTSSGNDVSIADFFFGMLHRLCRARFGTLSVRLFAHVACLLALICTDTPSELIPPHLTSYVEGIFFTVQRLWGPGLAKVGAVAKSGGDCCREMTLSRPLEKHPSSSSSSTASSASSARVPKPDCDRLIAHRRELMSFFTKGDRSSSHLNPVTACEFLLLTLRQKKAIH
uniref:Calponin-homology (CH) domain-containing protein n=2 Tax=Schistocephalus solidus TaxID=70667 RepID=A0A0X3NSN7_SCHSO